MTPDNDSPMLKEHGSEKKKIEASRDDLPLVENIFSKPDQEIRLGLGPFSYGLGILGLSPSSRAGLVPGITQIFNPYLSKGSKLNK